MTSPLAQLGLDQDADERAIKRAYAQRLRQARPDEDPAGFQALHALYQAALAWRRAQCEADLDEQDETDAEAAPVFAPPPAGAVALDAPGPAAAMPVAAPAWHQAAIEAPPPPVVPSVAAEPGIDPEQVARRIIERAADEDDAGALSQWLRTRPELWALEAKPKVGLALWWQLHDDGLAVSTHSFDALAAFFDWDRIGGPDAQQQQRLRARLNRACLFRPDHGAALRAYLRSRGMSADEVQPATRACLQQLRRPYSPWQALWAALPARRPTRMRHLVQLLDEPLALCDGLGIERRQADFWLAAGDPARLSQARLALGVARSLLVGLAIVLIFAIFGVSPEQPGPLQIVAATIGVTLAWQAVRTLLGWQCRAESHPTRWPWLRLFALPALGLLTLGVVHGLDARTAGTVLAGTLPVLGYLRLSARGQWQWQGKGWLLLALWPALKLLVIILTIAEVGVGAALVLWLIDLKLNWAGTRSWRKAH